jgi:hypothetical protein
MKSSLWKGFLALAVLSLLAMPVVSFSKEAVQDWEIINPEGTIKLEPMEINPHPASLEGKTVLLWANGKHNSDNFLTRVTFLGFRNTGSLKNSVESK